MLRTLATTPRPSTVSAALRHLATGARPFSTSMAAASAAEAPKFEFETLAVTRPAQHVIQVELNRPKKLNAVNRVCWAEMRDCFARIATDRDCRAVIITGAGRMFTAGLDLQDASAMFTLEADDAARRALLLRQIIKDYQDSFTNIEKCPTPVIAAVHNGCIGAGVDLITACDIRLCTADAYFQVKEVDVGLAADVGTLQRLPKVIGSDSLTRELAFTARKMLAPEAHQRGLVSHVYADEQELRKKALEMASLIASKSPVAVVGSKINLNYSRDHSVAESLEYMVRTS
ncbi:enoyl coenzyme A hydratase 1, variant [Capsaspora owczarzaki ATCC 30864]|uniref:Enoyl coenzyme A hydratase 1, variant n=1 Tax=Capsaspora owczarzaki (strain ATCC 30864) TaxID=595528 RepID=A0A0D2VVW4_CAPO3|nr:enoyl coenzyme A hydratase 1, variant [Capsaspora owczarzaki ATCC 30864]